MYVCMRAACTLAARFSGKQLNDAHKEEDEEAGRRKRTRCVWQRCKRCLALHTAATLARQSIVNERRTVAILYSQFNHNLYP